MRGKCLNCFMSVSPFRQTRVGGDGKSGSPIDELEFSKLVLKIFRSQ